jgi:hypothetical protein
MVLVDHGVCQSEARDYDERPRGKHESGQGAIFDQLAEMYSDDLKGRPSHQLGIGLESSDGTSAALA